MGRKKSILTMDEVELVRATVNALDVAASVHRERYPDAEANPYEAIARRWKSFLAQRGESLTRLAADAGNEGGGE